MTRSADEAREPLATVVKTSCAALDWRADTLITLTDLGKVDLDMERSALFGVVYARALGAAGQNSAAAQALITAEDDLACAIPETSPAPSHSSAGASHAAV